MLPKTRIADPQAERRLFFRRGLIAILLVAVGAASLAWQLINLQLINHGHYSTLSDGNRMRIEPVPPARGIIYDRNGVVLAENLPSFTLELVPEQVPDIDWALGELSRLVEIREQDMARFERQLRRQRRFEPVPLRFRLTEEEVANFALNRHRFAGVDIRATLTRNYPMDALAAHAIGYVGSISEADLQRIVVAKYSGTTHIGKTGIERRYEGLLHGSPGHRQVETNAQGRVLRVLTYTPPVAGRDIHLTLDHRLQRVAEDALGTNAGAIIVIDPNDGGVLAFVSKPAFDPNAFVDGIEVGNYRALENDPRRPMFNRALRGRYPPGSTVKPFLGLAALEHQTTLAGREIDCRGSFTLPGGTRRYRDWRRQGHGRVGLHRAVVESCDIYFYELAHELEIDRIHAFLQTFGFGRVTGIDLDGELEGLMPSREWKRRALNQAWFPGETIIVGIGQGYMLSTPLQLAQLSASLATRGHPSRPHLLMGHMDGDAFIPNPPTKEPPILLTDGTHWESMAGWMTGVMHSQDGTARASGLGAPVRIGGKTGTAQVFSLTQDDEMIPDPADVPYHLRDHALFIGYAPAEAPELAIAVVVEHGGGGGGHAAPVARRIIDAWVGLRTP